MYKLVQKNSKKLMAIFGVLLMIVFILPTTVKNQMRGGEQTMLSRGKEKVTAAQINSGRGEWQMLKQQVAVAVEMYPGGPLRLEPMAGQLVSGGDFAA